MTYKEFQLKIQSELLQIYDEEEAANISLILLEESSGKSRHQLRSLQADEIPETHCFKIWRWQSQLMQEQPLQYVLGYADFYGHRFLVNPSVLIPRRETEELVYRVLKSCKGGRHSILDIGCGSGCISISLQLEMPEAAVTAIDISKEALETAEKNAQNLGAGKICFDTCDILNREQWKMLGNYGIIVSNPPYVTESEKAGMHNNVLKHEPALALFVPDENPLKYYEAIGRFGLEHLLTGGQLFLEINESFGAATVKLLENLGYTAVELFKDMQGRDRIINAAKNS